MKLIWEPEEKDIVKVVELCTKYRENRRYKEVTKKNIARIKLDLSTDVFWQGVVIAIMKGLHYSGFGGIVHNFITRNLKDLSLQEMYLQKGNYDYIHAVLTKNKKIRSVPVFTERITDAFDRLNNSKWLLWRELAPLLADNNDKDVERRAVQAVASALDFNPLQARIVLYHIGLLKYEIPLYRKHAYWLRTIPLPFVVSVKKLQEEWYYRCIADCFIALCEQANIYPCQLDAAIHSDWKITSL